LHAYTIGGIEKDCTSGEDFIDVYDPYIPAGQGGVFNYNYSDFMTQLPGSIVYVLTR
jgi:hypothetical protein